MNEYNRTLFLSVLQELQKLLQSILEQVDGLPEHFEPAEISDRLSRVADSADHFANIAHRARSVASLRSAEKAGEKSVSPTLASIPEIPRRIVSTLRKNGFVTIAAVQTASDEDLLAIPNIGVSSLKILRAMLPPSRNTSI